MQIGTIPIYININALHIVSLIIGIKIQNPWRTSHIFILDYQPKQFITCEKYF